MDSLLPDAPALLGSAPAATFGACVGRAELTAALGPAAAGLGEVVLDAIFEATGGLVSAVEVVAQLVGALGHASALRLVERIGLDDALDDGALARQARASLDRLDAPSRAVLATAVVCRGTGPGFVPTLRRDLQGRSLAAHVQGVVAAGWLVGDARGDGALTVPLPLARVAWRVWPVPTELDDALRRLLAALAPRPDDDRSHLSDEGWTALLSALDLGRGALRTRWAVLCHLDDAARSAPRRTALDRVVAAGDPADAALRLMLARAFRRRGDFAGAVRLARAALGEPELTDVARLELGRAWYAWGRLAEAAEVLDTLGPEAEVDAQIEALGTRAAIALALDDPAVARALATDALVRARRARRDGSAGRLLGLLAAVELADAQLDAAHARAVEARAALDARGDAVTAALAEMTLADVLVGLGRMAEALDLCAAAEATLMQASDPRRATALCVAAVATLRRGELDAAAVLYETAVRTVDDRMPRLHGWVEGVGALVAATRGDTAGAAAQWERCAERFEAMGDVRLSRWFKACVARVTGRDQPDIAGGCAERAGLVASSGVAPRHPWGLVLDQAARRSADPPLRVDAAGAWVERAGQRLDLSSRSAPSRLLAALAQARAAGVSLSTAALFSAGWPGERASHESARARVYVALGVLRRAGLEAHLHRTVDGYRLDGVEVVDAPSPG